MNTISNEKRKHIRTNLSNLMTYKINNQILTTFVKDIGEGGLCFEPVTDLPQNSHIQLLVNLPKKNKKLGCCNIQGKVVHLKDNTARISFCNLLPRHMLEIRDFVYRAQHLEN